MSAHTWTMSISGLELKTQKSWSPHPEILVPDSKCLLRLVSLLNCSHHVHKESDRKWIISAVEHTVIFGCIFLNTQFENFYNFYILLCILYVLITKFVSFMTGLRLCVVGSWLYLGLNGYMGQYQ